MSTPSTIKENQEREEVLRNDARMRDQERAATMHGHAIASADDEAGGRFAKINPTMVVGATPLPKYPAASSAHQTMLPDEPPLGYSIDDLASSTGFASPVVTGPASDAPSPLMVEGDVPRSDVGPSSSEEQTK